MAKRTWARQPWTEIPISDHQVRCYQDPKGKVPDIKSIIGLAVTDKKDEDIIILTNSDICVSSDCSIKIAVAMQSISAAYCFRRDFRRLPDILPDAAIQRGHQYCGSDLYAFRVGWWRKYENEFPDMLLGREAWDAVLRVLIEQTHPKQNPTVYNLIYHENHASVWENPINRRSIPSQLYNIDLARSFCWGVGFDPRKIGL